MFNSSPTSRKLYIPFLFCYKASPMWTPKQENLLRGEINMETEEGWHMTFKFQSRGPGTRQLWKKCLFGSL